MTLEMIRAALAWCSVLNLGVLLVWFLVYAIARDWLYRLHGRWFRITEERFDVIHYSGMALYKIGILLFNLVPYLALRFIA